MPSTSSKRPLGRVHEAALKPRIEQGTFIAGLPRLVVMDTPKGNPEMIHELYILLFVHIKVEKKSELPVYFGSKLEMIDYNWQPVISILTNKI